MSQVDSFNRVEAAKPSGGHLLSCVIALLIVVLTGLVCASTWGPDANWLDQAARRADSEKGAGIKQELLWRSSILWRQIFLGPDHPDIAIGLKNLANYFSSQGHYEQAEPLLRQAVAIQERRSAQPDTLDQLKDLDRRELIETLGNLTAVRIKQKKYQEAAVVMRRTCALLSQNQTDVAQIHLYREHYKTIRPYLASEDAQQLARNFPARLWNVSLAERINQVDKRMAENQQELPFVALKDATDLLRFMAEFCLRMGRYAEAADAISHSIELQVSFAQKSKSYRIDTMTDRCLLALCYEQEGNFKAAENCYQTVIQNSSNKNEADRACLAVAMSHYKDVEQQLGKPDLHAR